MTIEELKKSGSIIFECISGSRAYGLATATSDTDIRGVFVLPKEQYYSLNYIDQMNNETNDVVYYELNKFASLCAKNNPNILELLNTPEDCILHKNPLFEKFETEDFLSKLSYESFANYAFTQIKKARGLEKKIANPMEKERKTVLDFCTIYFDGKTLALKYYLDKFNLKQEFCGLSKLPHLRDSFNLFYDENSNYSGIIRSENSNEVNLSLVAKEEKALTMLYFNREAYSTYCKQYREYWEWVEKRNETRYESTISHGKNYDAKNLMHTFRLLNMAKEIAVDGKLNVRRTDRNYLLDIKNGKFEYDDLVVEAENLKNDLEELFSKSELKEKPDLEKMNRLIFEIRNEFYNSYAK
ncbi:nucleotidyltransferase domain-containing protein [Moheibacter sediminis]|uniref:Predicted nucleotidyltransferase n=1 Tax=Moheibacter sediminis TaxID=1434700 RepID=A0A1W2C7M3_9FLAO|nr:nucleotidyltransferase domain-containing protein [Moheibacter sediminis]SMC81140.1 Predicted nucleotidyltransferase [Moheibacter sediminis]